MSSLICLPVQAALPLFTLERNLNSNLLTYEWTEHRRQPVRALWKMLATDGHEEELSALERNYAYGVDIHERAEDKVRFALRALPQFFLTAKRHEGQAVVTASILGRETIVERVFVVLGPGLLPAVESIRVAGRAHAGATLEEFSFQTKDGLWSRR